MSNNICTGDRVWFHAGTTSRRGIVQGISINFLGQVVYLIDGQFYSDPVIERSLRIGDTVFLRDEADREANVPKVGRVLGVRSVLSSFSTMELVVSLECWDGSTREWVPHAPVYSGDLGKGDFRENVPVGRSIVVQK